MNKICIKSCELLTVDCGGGVLTTGGDQYWLPKEGFIPGGACGATTASNILAYLLRTRPELYGLASAAGLDAPQGDKAGYIEFIKKVYKFLYPRLAGLMINEFLEGIGLLAKEYGLPVFAECLRVPIGRSKRPSFAEAAGFIEESLKADIPAAFLILSNGCVANLDTWHWVTILSISKETGQIDITDNGKVLQADLGEWLGASIMGGAFVRLRILNDAVWRTP
jgi:hypothetical protein